MPQVTGTVVKLAGFTETAYNTTPGAPDGLLLYARSIGVQAQSQAQQDDTLAGYRGMLRPVRDLKDVQGSIACNIGAASIGFWLKHLMGAPTTTGTTNKTHTFAPAMPGGATSLPAGMLLEEDLGAAFTGASRYLRYSGCRIARAQFSFTPGGFAQAQFDIRGANVTKSATPLDATLTDNGHTAFSNQVASLTVGGGAITLCPTSFGITYENDLDDSNYCIGAGGIRGSMPEGFVMVSGTIETLLTDASLLDLLLADTNSSFAFKLQNGTGDGSAGNESLTFNLPNVSFDLTTPAVQNSKGVRLSANWKAFRTTGEIGVNAVLTNTIATYP